MYKKRKNMKQKIYTKNIIPEIYLVFGFVVWLVLMKSGKLKQANEMQKMKMKLLKE